MRYLCLVYCDGAAVEAPPAAESAADGRGLGGGDEPLRLLPVQGAATVRVWNRNLTVSDGPIARSSERMDGFCLVEARDLNDAIRMAAALLPSRAGWVEVWPVVEPGRR